MNRDNPFSGPIPVKISEEPEGAVSELIYGQFIEHILTCIDGGIWDPDSPLSDDSGIRTDVLQKLKLLAPPVMRFPGGTVMCQYHWQDAVGPAEQRIRRQNLIWGGELSPEFGTAEFIGLCRRLGAEPMICVNMASGTPEEAAHWVEYCNGTGNTYYANLRRSHGYEEPFRVQYWCIGNECYSEPDIGIHHDVQLYIRDAMEFIKWMKLTDRSIKTVVVGCDDMDWNKKVLDKLHPVTDYLSYHHYSNSLSGGPYSAFLGENQLRRQLDRIAELIDTYPESVEDFPVWYRFPPRQEKIRIALDEWNIWDYRPDETYGLLQTYRWSDALWTASVLNLLVDMPQIGMANLAQSVNVIAPVVAQAQGSWLQTIAYPLLHYRKRMLGSRLRVSFRSPIVEEARESVDALRISAVVREDGEICIAAVNRDLHRSLTILPEGIPAGPGKLFRLEGTDPEDTCSMTRCCVREFREDIPQGSPVVLPPASVSFLSFCAGEQ